MEASQFHISQIFHKGAKQLKKNRLNNFLIILLMLVTASIFFSCARGSSPEDALKRFVNLVIEKKWDLVWDSISYDSQKKFDEVVFQPIKNSLKNTPVNKRNIQHPLLGISIQNLMDMSSKDFFTLNLEKTGVRNDLLNALNPDKLKIEKVETRGNIARIKVSGRKQDINMKKEDGQWKICLF